MIEFDIIDYMGKFEDGVMVMLDLKYNNKHYNGTFFYTEDTIALTTDSELEQELRCDIEDYPGYKQLVFDILKRVIPYNEIINSIDKIDLTNYIEMTDDDYIYEEGGEEE